MPHAIKKRPLMRLKHYMSFRILIWSQMNFVGILAIPFELSVSTSKKKYKEGYIVFIISMIGKFKE